jgi:H+/Cl- antiporter ClcA
MKLDRVIRIGIAAVIALLFVIAIAALLFVTESALNVWDRLVEGPRVLLYGYIAVMAILVIVAGWLIWRLVVRRKIPDARRSDAQPLSAADIRERLSCRTWRRGAPPAAFTCVSSAKSARARAR